MASRWLGSPPAHSTYDPLGAHKIGKTGVESSRLQAHRRKGWQVYRTLRFDTGRGAAQVEQAVIRWWREDLGLPPYLADVDGWTETIDADAMGLPELWRRVLAEAAAVHAGDQA